MVSRRHHCVFVQPHMVRATSMFSLCAVISTCLGAARAHDSGRLQIAPAKVAASAGAPRPCPAFGFGNEFLFQTFNDSGLNLALEQVCACMCPPPLPHLQRLLFICMWNFVPAYVYFIRRGVGGGGE